MYTFTRSQTESFAHVLEQLMEENEGETTGLEIRKFNKTYQITHKSLNGDRTFILGHRGKIEWQQ